MTHQRLILTIPQAHMLQQHLATLPEEQQTQWGEWAFALQPEREKPDSLSDPERMTIGLVMKARGCTDEQIAAQVGWKLPSGPINQVNRLHKRGQSLNNP